MIVKTNLMPPGAVAFTAYPFIFVHPDAHQGVLDHEQVHLEQQRRWAIRGLGVGLLVWFFLYLFCLPAGWNYFRRKWETEAMTKADRLDPKVIDAVLSNRPYYLKSRL